MPWFALMVLALVAGTIPEFFPNLWESCFEGSRRPLRPQGRSTPIPLITMPQARPPIAPVARETLNDYHFTGRHLLASYVGCNPQAMENIPRLLQAMEEAARASGATILKSEHHIFPPHGLTAVLLLSESHASIHTYPEHRACFVDLFTCGNTCQAEEFDRLMRAYLRPTGGQSRFVLRHDAMEVENAHGKSLT